MHEALSSLLLQISLRLANPMHAAMRNTSLVCQQYQIQFHLKPSRASPFIATRGIARFIAAVRLYVRRFDQQLSRIYIILKRCGSAEPKLA